jgi:hypothetical protein
MKFYSPKLMMELMSLSFARNLKRTGLFEIQFEQKRARADETGNKRTHRHAVQDFAVFQQLYFSL